MTRPGDLDAAPEARELRRTQELDRLWRWIEDLRRDLAALLASPAYRAGEFFISRLASLTARPGRHLAWAPREIQEIGNEVDRWQADRSALPNGMSPTEILRRQAKEIGLLTRWLERLAACGDQILCSRRWRLGRAVAQLPLSWLPGARRKDPAAAVRGTVEAFRHWLCCPGAGYFGGEGARTADERPTMAGTGENGGRRVGFAVTEAGPQARAGDSFTALELAAACADELGWHCRLLPAKGPGDCYDVEGLDALVILIDDYDLRRIHHQRPGLITVAWARNWFDRWLERPWFSNFALTVASSRKAASFLSERGGRPCYLLRLATDPDRFSPGEPDPAYSSDYCFTGSYWNRRREIEKTLRPRLIGGQAAIFGSGWQDHRQLRHYDRGFVPYDRIEIVYQSTLIVVDDANVATKRWASVNSRVFDGLACGALVVTNGVEGAHEVFGEALPTYSSQAELTHLLRRHLAEEGHRRRLVRQLRQQVLTRHTYTHRARTLEALVERAQGAAQPSRDEKTP